VADEFNNGPTAGATVEVTADACEILGGTTTVPNAAPRGGFVTTFTALNQSDNTADLRGFIEISVEGSTGSNDITATFQCVDLAN
ncbi:MAG: hypothetical protein V2J89_03435, partial [Halieaceae bacterium]|nr:hypothetical protein [Halieaceae bacterium]